MEWSYFVKSRGLFIAVALFLVGCSEGTKPFVGETYQTVAGDIVIRIHSDTELEYKKGSSQNFVAKYTIEGGDRLRVVLTTLGTTEALYYQISEDGLLDEEGRVLYSTARLADAREQAFCGLLQSDLEELAQAQDDFREKHGDYLLTPPRPLAFGVFDRHPPIKYKPSKGVVLSIAGEQGTSGWYSALVTHHSCSKAFLYASAAGGFQEPIAVNQAAGDIKQVAGLSKIKRVMLSIKEKSTIEKQKINSEDIVKILESGKSYFGKEEGDPPFYFRIHFQSFDKRSGDISGIMDYYPENDRAVLSFSGRLDGPRILLRHTGTIREGQSIPAGKYTYFKVGEQLKGTYSWIDGRGLLGRVHIDLREADRVAKEREVAELERRLGAVEKRVRY